VTADELARPSSTSRVERAIFTRWSIPAIAAAIVFLFGSAQLFAGALAVGVTTDEPIHVSRTASWFSTGWYVPQQFIADGEPDGSPVSSAYVYGPAVSAVAHAVNVVVGNETLGEVSQSAYAVRHLVVAVLGWLTALAAGIAVGTLTGSRAFGLWGTAGLLAVPVWMGQSFFNVKDVPAACGYTLVTVGLVLALQAAGGRTASPIRKLAIAALLALGFYLGAGTRLVLWGPLLVSLAVYGLLRFARRRFGAPACEHGTDVAVLVGCVVGVAAAAAIYPKAAASPAAWAVDSITDSSAYPWSGYTLTAGQLLSEHPPLWYLPTWLFASLPLLLTALAVLGAVGGVRSLARKSPGAPLRRVIWDRRELGLALVFLQGLLLPAGAMATGAVMYSGLRQHLYIVPMIAVLSGVGAHWLWSWARERGSSTSWRTLTAGSFVSVALIAPMAEQTPLFPYNYTYVNAVAGVGGVDGRWETDYWFASAPEALARVPRGAELWCSFWLTVPWAPSREAPFERCEGPYFSPFGDRRGTDVAQLGASHADVWVIARKRGGNYPPDYCRSVADVTRRMRTERVTIAYVLRCAAQRMPVPPSGA
jgi:hypothetical protein